MEFIISKWNFIEISKMESFEMEQFSLEVLDKRKFSYWNFVQLEI